MALSARPSEFIFWIISTFAVILFVTAFRLWISPHSHPPKPIHQCEIMWQIEEKEESMDHSDTVEEFAPIFVLLWTPLDGHFANWKRHLGAGYNAFVERCHGPSSRRCVFTDDRAMLEVSAIVIFSVSDLRDHLYEERDDWAQNELPPMPNGRPPGQIWALFWRDPPGKVKISAEKLSWLDAVFNWTISYRRDADVFYPFGMFKVKQATLKTVLKKSKGKVNVFLGQTSGTDNSAESAEGEERHRLGKKPFAPTEIFTHMLNSKWRLLSCTVYQLRHLLLVIPP